MAAFTVDKLKNQKKVCKLVCNKAHVPPGPGGPQYPYLPGPLELYPLVRSRGPGACITLPPGPVQRPRGLYYSTPWSGLGAPGPVVLYPPV